MDNSLVLKDFKLIVDIADKQNLSIFLHAGTLLGIYRENDFIEGDRDLDFGIFEKDFTPEIKQRLFDELISNKFIYKGTECEAFKNKLESNYIPYVYKFWTPNAHINLDFWLFKKENNIYYHRGWLGYFYFLNETLDQLESYNFKDIEVTIPKNTELFLEYMYGKDWKTPKKMKKPNDYTNWSKELCIT